jgi:hypothetical protein
MAMTLAFHQNQRETRYSLDLSLIDNTKIQEEAQCIFQKFRLQFNSEKKKHLDDNIASAIRFNKVRAWLKLCQPSAQYLDASQECPEAIEQWHEERQSILHLCLQIFSKELLPFKEQCGQLTLVHQLLSKAEREKLYSPLLALNKKSKNLMIATKLLTSGSKSLVTINSPRSLPPHIFLEERLHDAEQTFLGLKDACELNKQCAERLVNSFQELMKVYHTELSEHLKKAETDINLSKNTWDSLYKNSNLRAASLHFAKAWEIFTRLKLKERLYSQLRLSSEFIEMQLNDHFKNISRSEFQLSN